MSSGKRNSKEFSSNSSFTTIRKPIGYVMFKCVLKYSLYGLFQVSPDYEQYHRPPRGVKVRPRVSAREVFWP